MKSFTCAQRAVSVSILLAALFGSASATIPAPQINKSANSKAFLDCTLNGLRDAYLVKFRQAASSVRPGAEESTMRDMMVNAVTSEQSSEITMSCISRITGVSLDQMPPVSDQSRFVPFYLTHFEEAAGRKTIEAVSAMRRDVEKQGLEILKQGASRQPG